MEFQVKKVLGSNARSSSSVALTALPSGQPASVTCVGAGAVLIPLSSELDIEANEVFYYHAPKPGPSDTAGNSPKGSPEPPSSPGHKLARVNKASCVDANSKVSMVAVGEASGYMPRLLLFDMLSGDCLSVLRDQHQFGVHRLKFAPSGKYLATLGTPQDGFLYVWSVVSGQLELQASNRCISEVRDLVWLNDSQFVTCGVRHIKLWTVGSESILTGRNVLLKETLDQTFERVCSFPNLHSEDMLVGTARGSLFRMPGVEHLTTLAPAEPIKAITLLDSNALHVLVSTQNHIFEFDGSFDSPSKVYPFGTTALLNLESSAYYLTQNVNGGGAVVPLPAAEGTPRKAEARTAELTYSKGLQMRGSHGGKVVLWRADEPAVWRWPGERLEMPFSDVTTAYETLTESGLMVGSLCGDLWIGGEVFNAHNGPITDLHQVGTISVSAGRDRCVQVWLQSYTAKQWELVQTLMFTSPILKAKLCVRGNGAVALACLAANKTAYFYVASVPSAAGVAGPLFSDAPKSHMLKGMPLDVVASDDAIIVSTNDKNVSIFDPFTDQEKLKLTWRAYNSNAEAVNATQLQLIEYKSTPYLLAAGSDKCVHLFTYPKGELVATQWGHAEPLSGLAWTGSEVLSASDSLTISSISSGDVTRTSRPRISAQADSMAMPRLVLPKAPRDTSPLRKIYNPAPLPRPRSMSPQRGPTPRVTPRSPSPTRERVQPPRLADPGPPSPMAREKDSAEKQLGLTYKPLRLATPSTQARHVSAAASAVSSPTKQDPTERLECALRQFIEQPLSQRDTQELKTLLASALNKIDAFALVEAFSERVYGCIESRLEGRLDDARLHGSNE